MYGKSKKDVVETLRHDDEDDEDEGGEKKFKFSLARKDEHGRVLTKKQAYRELLQAYHGTRSGINQKEKEKKQYQKMKQAQASAESDGLPPPFLNRPCVFLRFHVFTYPFMWVVAMKKVETLHEVQKKVGKAHVKL